MNNSNLPYEMSAFKQEVFTLLLEGFGSAFFGFLCEEELTQPMLFMLIEIN